MNSLQVFFQSDGNMAASVRVPTPQDAQYAISQLHRKKVNFKQFFLHTVVIRSLKIKFSVKIEVAFSRLLHKSSNNDLTNSNRYPCSFYLDQKPIGRPFQILANEEHMFICCLFCINKS